MNRSRSLYVGFAGPSSHSRAARSSHSCDVAENYMILRGGIRLYSCTISITESWSYHNLCSTM
jgi:hypothetical protein